MELWGFERGFEVVGESMGLLQQVPVKPPIATPAVTIKPRVGTTPSQPTPSVRSFPTIPATPAPTGRSQFTASHPLINLGRQAFGLFGTTSPTVTIRFALGTPFPTPQVPFDTSDVRQISNPPTTQRGIYQFHSGTPLASRVLARQGNSRAFQSLADVVRSGRSQPRDTHYQVAVNTIAQIARQISTQNPRAPQAFQEIAQWVRDHTRTDQRLILRTFTSADPKLTPYTEAHVAFLFEVAVSIPKAAPDALEALATGALSCSDAMGKTCFRHLLRLALPEETSPTSEATQKEALKNIYKIANSQGPFAYRALEALIEARRMGSVMADELLGKIETLPASPLSQAQLNTLLESGNTLARAPLMNILESVLPAVRAMPDKALKPLHDEMMKSLIIIATEELPVHSKLRPMQNSTREALNRIFSNVYDAKSLEALLRRLFFLKSLHTSTLGRHHGGRDPRRSRGLALLMAYWDMVTYLDGKEVLQKLMASKK